MRKIRKEAEMTDTRPLTPEILTEQGWEKGEDTPFGVYFRKDLDEPFMRNTDFCAYMLVRFRKFPNSTQYHVQFDIERAIGDSIRSTFKRNITVGEFNTLLDIVKLEKFKIK